ncbi:MAG: hypothetical protein J4431_02225 [Candidatus Aenigmarchaeota archaeon]|nr:hypothetical protein [Candidatus Aenigmarchaeota archaeon]
MEEEEIKNRILHQRIAEENRKAEEAIKGTLSLVLEPKAKERLDNIRVVKPEVAQQLDIYLSQLYHSGQLKTKITEEQLVQILRKINEKREFNIKRK